MILLRSTKWCPNSTVYLLDFFPKIEKNIIKFYLFESFRLDKG